MYVDGFVIPVPTKNLAAYKKISRQAGKVWMEYGALQYVECAGDDLKIEWGLPFAKMVQPKKGETIIFSWILYKSKAQRDRINKQVMKDPRIKCDPNNMPFDVKRMSYGGFKTIIEFGKN